MTKTLTDPSPTDCCSNRPRIGERPALSDLLATEMEGLFKVLANRTRLRMLHTMVCCQEICVGELADRLGMKPQAVSNQLQRLVDRRIVSSRRSGSNIFYKFVDPCLQILLERGLCLMEDIRNSAAPPMMEPGYSMPVLFDYAENALSEVEDDSIQQKGNIGHE